MPSIFIWKADSSNTSKKMIRFYSGSNWVLEDNDYSSKSYMYLEQIVISESDNSVITFKSRDMPQDWVGSELLEVSNVPYEMVKSDNYGTLEKIGDWMRFTTKGETEFNSDFLKNEFASIKKWMSNKYKQNDHSRDNRYNRVQKTYQKQQTNISLDPTTIKLNFEEFLIKYNVPNSITDISLTDSNSSNNYKKHHPHNFKKGNMNTSKPYNKPRNK